MGIVYRLDAIHKQIHIQKVEKNIESWFSWLESLHVELSRMMKVEKAQKEKYTEFDYLEGFRTKAKQALSQARDELKRKGTIRQDVAEIFYEWEIELTRFEQTKGLGMPKKRDARYALSS